MSAVPGLAKHTCLKELLQRLKSRGTPHLLLPIEQLGDGTDESLRQELPELSDEGDPIEKLKSLPIFRQKAVLLFDAFDAARDEQTRQTLSKPD